GVLLHDVIDLVAGPSGFSIEIAADMPTILTDRLRLQQVFQNLISNAIKHHNRADGHVEVSVRDIGRMYEFALADDGPGIAPEYHEKIFVIFQTLAARDKVEGTGIGLALIKKIVENHGGRVWVESAEGTGTTFRFTWPKRTPEGEARMDKKLLHILLVDDDEIDVMNVQRAFKRNNITNPLYVASNGLEALAMLRSKDGIPGPRRLILLDLNMPKMNGLEFLRALREDPALRPLTVVVLTTSDDERDRIEAYNLNVAGYILKPVTMTAFVEAMATLNKYWTINEFP